MSVTTSQRLNQDALDALLPNGYSWTGGRLADAGEKTISSGAYSDGQLGAAVTQAVGIFVDRDANRATLQQRAQGALATNDTFLGHAAIPAGTLTAAQLSGAVRLLADQVDALTRECSALIRLLLGQVDATAGTGP